MEANPLWKALAKVQREIGDVGKDATNPHFNSGYASLAAVLGAIRKPFTKHGLVMYQRAIAVLSNGETVPEKHLAMETTIVHVDTGESVTDTRLMPLAKNDSQGLGSAETYARRYSLKSLLGIAEVDDDGEAAKAPEKVKPDGAAIAFYNKLTRLYNECVSIMVDDGGLTKKAAKEETDGVYRMTLKLHGATARDQVDAGDRERVLSDFGAAVERVRRQHDPDMGGE